jgi:hypothetical protein
LFDALHALSKDDMRDDIVWQEFPQNLPPCDGYYLIKTELYSERTYEVWYCSDERVFAAHAEAPTRISAKYWAHREVTKGIAEGDIIQLQPSHRWGPCLLTVTDVKTWGVQAYLCLPDGHAFLRVRTGEFEKVGRAAYIRDPEGEDDDSGTS